MVKSPVSVLDRRSFLRGSLSTALLIPILGKVAAAEPSAISNLPERSLSLYNLHTSESLKTVYWQDGEGYVASSLADINRVLRDHHSGDEHDIDPRLLDLLCELRLKLGTTQPLHVFSGYRSPATNAKLHSRSDGVASRSLHMEGMAADICIPGRALSLVRKSALSMKAGGVGYYPSSGFVHVDVGRVRTW